MNNFTVSAFMLPKGTMISRPMTLSECKVAARKGYAKYLISQLLKIHDSTDVNDLQTKAYGTKVILTFKCNQAVLKFQSNGWSRGPIVCPFYDKSDGQYSLEQWVTSQDPCVGARLLKNAYKKILDRKSREGQMKKQTHAEPHSPMAIYDFTI